MKKYTAHRSVYEVKKAAARRGFVVDTYRYDNFGDDHIVVHYKFDGMKYAVLYNCVNGRFLGELPDSDRMFTSDDASNDGKPWFDNMLDFFYLSPVPA